MPRHFSLESARCGGGDVKDVALQTGGSSGRQGFPRILYEEKPAPHIEFKVVHKTAPKPANEISILPLLANATPPAGMVYTGDVTPPASPGNSTHRAFHGGAAEVMASLGDHQGYHGP